MRWAAMRAISNCRIVALKPAMLLTDLYDVRRKTWSPGLWRALSQGEDGGRGARQPPRNRAPYHAAGSPVTAQ